MLCFRKYVQVCVQNLSELDFRLSDSNLTDTGASADLQLAPLNTEPQQVSVCELSRRPQAVHGTEPLGVGREPTARLPTSVRAERGTGDARTPRGVCPLRERSLTCAPLCAALRNCTLRRESHGDGTW